MKTGFFIFFVGIILTMVGVSAPDEAPIDTVLIIAGLGLGLMWCGVRLMKGRGSLVDNPTLK